MRKITSYQSPITRSFWGCLLILLVCLLSSVFCLLGAGCDSTSAERIAVVKSVVDNMNTANQSINISAEGLNKTIAELELMFADPNIPAESKPTILESLSAARSKLNVLLLQKQKVDAVLIQAQTTLNSINPNDVNERTEFAAYGEVAKIAGQTAGGSLGGYIYLAGVLAPLIGGLVTQIIRQVNKIKKQQQDINQLKTAATDLVVTNDKLLNPAENGGVIPADKVGDAKLLLKNNLLDTTSDLVDAIHDPMQNTAPAK